MITELQALAATCTRAPGTLSVSSDRAGAGRQLWVCRPRSAIRSATTTWRRTLLVPTERRPVGAASATRTRALPVVRLSLAAHRAARPRPDHRRRQHDYRQHVARARRLDRAAGPADADVVGELSFGYTVQRVRARRSRCRSRDPTQAASSSPPETGPDANVFLRGHFSNVHAWHYSISSQEGRRVQLNLPALRPERWAAGSTPTEISGSGTST